MFDAMLNVLPHMVVAAILGAGLISGLLFAFSIVVMRALLELPAPLGMRTMQRVNVIIIRPLFLALFVGTAALCAVIGVVVLGAGSSTAGAWLLAGAASYLLGPFGVTAAFNVPLNNRLAVAPAAEAESVWPTYAASWLRWNHVRSLLGAVSVVLLGVGLYLLRPG